MPDLYDYNQIQDHLTALVPPRTADLKDMEAYAEEHGFPIIGPAAGYTCYQVARMTVAKNIFELGSGYGYSTAWFARAVRENGGGKVYHTVWDRDLSLKARQYLNRLGYTDLVQYRIGEAVEALRTTPGTFDLIFNDIDKEAYPNSLPLIKQKLRRGGVLIIDNMLWHGRIFDPADQDVSTAAIRRFTHDITTDPDWIVSLLPIRDGLIVAYKK